MHTSSQRPTLLRSTLLTLTAALACLLPSLSHAESSEEYEEPKETYVEVLSRDGIQNPTFMTGDLGTLDLQGVEDPLLIEARAVNALQALLGSHFQSGGGEAVHLVDLQFDAVGNLHLTFDQSIDGMEVHLANLRLHVRGDGTIFALNGHYASGFGLTRQAEMEAYKAMGSALHEAGVTAVEHISEPKQVMVLDPLNETLHLAYYSRVSHQGSEGPALDDLYANAIDGRLVLKNPRLHGSKTWTTYSADGGPGFVGSPPDYPHAFTGHVQCSNDTCSDPNGQILHDHLSLAYDFFLETFGRRSFDDADGELIATGDWQDALGNGNNAFWTPDTHVFGRGDGVTFGPLGEALDIVIHEVTHGVTHHTSGLLYELEQGGLNESMSDIFAAIGEACRDGGVNENTWKMGEDAFTPGIPGDALRYLNDPSADGVSYDRYEDYRAVLRIFRDGLGPLPDVHYSSGIPNLAFYLISEGGSHPRPEFSLPYSNLSVQGLGIHKAAQIFYDAQAHYLTLSSNFQHARYATQQAAFERYGMEESLSVARAWCIVGVEGCPASVQNQAPVADFDISCGADPSQPRTCTFDASASHDDRFISSYQWNFGNGQIASGRIVQTTYSEGGWYPVTLDVRDSENLSDQLTLETSVGAGDLSPWQGLWWNPARNGNGLDLQQASDGSLFITWFTFRPDGTPIWYTALGQTFGDEWRGDLKRWRRLSSGAMVPTDVGEVSLDFASDQQANFRWDFRPLNAPTPSGRPWDGSEAFEYLHFASGTVPVPLTDQWFDSNDPGWGYSIASQGNVQVVTAFIYRLDGQPTWVQGTDVTGASDMWIPMHTLQGTHLHPESNGAPSTTLSEAGHLELQQSENGSVRTRPSFQVPASVSWNRPWTTSIPIQ